MYNKSLIAKNAHFLTRTYDCTQSEAWKLAWSNEKRRVRKLRKLNHKRVAVINKIKLSSQKERLIHCLNIIQAMDVHVERNGVYLNLYYYGKLDGYLYSFGHEFYVQLANSTIQLSLKEYQNYAIERISRINGTTVPGTVERVEEYA